MAITARNVTKRFGDFVALEDVSVDVPSGSLTALLGPSGGGKSTLLRIIAGLEHPDSGLVEIAGTDATRLPPQSRNVGFVFQHYAAFKHMSVYRNVAFGLEIRKRPKEEIKRKVDELLELVHLEQFAHPAADLVLGPAPDLQPEGDVAEHGEVLERGVVLEHEAHVAPLGRHPGGVHPVDLDRAGVRLLEPADDPQQRRLAAAARAEQRGQLARRHREVHIGQCSEVAEPLGDGVRLDTHQLFFSLGRSSEMPTMQRMANSTSTSAIW